MSTTQFVGNYDVAAVAEMAFEPSYISEIARKLQEVDEVYQNRSLNRVIRIVSRAAFAMEQEGRLTVTRPPLTGNINSSPMTSLSGEGFSESEGWKEYTVIHSDIPISSVRDSYLTVLDRDVTMGDKLEVVDFLSRSGNIMAKNSEAILQDQVEVFDYDYVDKSEYTSPDVDVYMEIDGKGYAIEISTRWVNPISGPYVNSKLDLAMEKEAERGFPVDLLIMAPRFTNRERRKREDSDNVTLTVIPEESDGNPVIIADFPEVSDGFGPEYPIVDEEFNTFTDDLSFVFRDYTTIEESRYREQITQAINDVL